MQPEVATIREAQEQGVVVDNHSPPLSRSLINIASSEARMLRI